MSAFALSQLLIAIAFCADLVSFQLRDRRHVLVCLAMAAALIGAHFWLLQAYTAAILGFVASARFISAIYLRSKVVLWVFVCVVLINALLTFAGMLTVLGTVGSLISTTAAFAASDRVFRKLMMLSSVVWIVHNVAAVTPAAVALELFFLGSNLVGYYRHYFSK